MTPTDVQAFVAHLEHRGLAPSTIRQAYLLVAGLFSSAVDSDLIARSPCRGIRIPPKTRTEMRFLTAAEVLEVADAIAEPYRVLVLTAAYTGCRFGELAGMRVHRLDLLRRTLTIAEALSDVQGQGETVSTEDGRRTASGGAAEIPRRRAGDSPRPLANGCGRVRVHRSRRRTASPHQLPPTRLASGGAGFRR